MTKPYLRPAALVLAGGLAALGLVVGLYGMGRPGGKAAHFAGSCPLTAEAATKARPLARGDVAALKVASEDHPLGEITFDRPDGTKTTLASFKGQTVLLNLWATWCIPCRAEMPALAKLQETHGSKDFAVVAVNIDTARLEKPPAFLKEIGATALPYYADHSADILQQLKRSDKIEGLPTTILIGKDGCEIGLMEGPAAWDSKDAHDLIERVAS